MEPIPMVKATCMNIFVPLQAQFVLHGLLTMGCVKLEFFWTQIPIIALCEIDFCGKKLASGVYNQDSFTDQRSRDFCL